MGDLIRRLLIVYCLFAILLTACGFGGVFVEPTVPTGDAHVSETKQTFPTETGGSPTEGTTLQPESVPVTVPPTVAPTEPTATATVPPMTAPTPPTEPETDPPQPTSPVPGRHDPKQPENYSVSFRERALLDQIHTMRSGKKTPCSNGG